MAPRPPLPSALRQRREQRSQRLLATRAIRDSIVSLAGTIGGPVCNQRGEDVGRIVDFVARWDGAEPYPPITGMVAAVGRQEVYVPATNIRQLSDHRVQLRSAELDVREFERRPGEVLLTRDVLDHQLVDVDGIQVIRAADLYLARVGPDLRLVGADVSLQTLLRRLGPRRWRSRPTPEKVIDWAAIQPFGSAVNQVKLRTSHAGLQRLRPGELADLLEDLGRPARQELLASLETDAAADALEEMDPEELETLLRETPPHHAAALLAEMEPDEAADALRDLAHDERMELLRHMEPAQRQALAALLDYDEDSAGGVMTTFLVIASPGERVEVVRTRLNDECDHKVDIDAIVIIDSHGHLVDDISLFDLVVADGTLTMADLAHDEPPVTVSADAEIKDVAARLVDSRRSSVLVVDDNKVLGRILADDVVDALLPEGGRFHFPRLLQ
jgi:CBS domain-containing protein